MTEREALKQELPRVEQPEQSFESPAEPERAVNREQKRETSTETETLHPTSYTPPPALPAAPAKDPTLRQVEQIMEEELADTYAALPVALQAKFKARGEEVANAIKEMLSGAHVQGKKVLHLIFSWLRLIPNVNRFFLEQAAKIKTDRILALADKMKGKGR